VKRNLQLIFYSIFITVSAWSNLQGQTQLLEIKTENFYTNFLIEKDSEGTSYLITDITLNNNSYVISPFSTDTIYGHLNLSIQESESISYRGSLSESPFATEEFDPIIETKVKFVRVNTRYKQELQIKSKEDFQVKGHLWFLLEPQCIPYKVEYLISQVDGNLFVEKTSTETDY